MTSKTRNSDPSSAVRFVLFAVLLVGATATQAQFPGGGAGGGAGGGRGGMGGMSPGRNAGDGPREGASLGTAADIVAQMEMNLSSLAEDLRLTPAQRSAWTIYADRLRKFAEDVSRNRSAMRFPRDEAPRQFDLLVGSATNRLTAIEEFAEAGKKLYEALAPDQREIADRRLARIVTPLVTGDLPAGMPGAGGPRGAGPRGEQGGPRQ